MILSDRSWSGSITTISKPRTRRPSSRQSPSDTRWPRWPAWRRAAGMGIGFLVDYAQNAVLGRALRDRDRGVRLLADSGIRQLWRRDGNRRQQDQMARLCRLNQNDQYAE